MLKKNKHHHHSSPDKGQSYGMLALAISPPRLQSRLGHGGGVGSQILPRWKENAGRAEALAPAFLAHGGSWRAAVGAGCPAGAPSLPCPPCMLPPAPVCSPGATTANPALPCIHAPTALQPQDSPKVPGKPRGHQNLLLGWGNLGVSRVPAPTSVKSTGSDSLKVRAEPAKGTNVGGRGRPEVSLCFLFPFPQHAHM